MIEQVIGVRGGQLERFRFSDVGWSSLCSYGIPSLVKTDATSPFSPPTPDLAATTISPSPQRRDLAPVEFSNDYFTFHSSGCGGSHLLVQNHAHAALEVRVTRTFRPSVVFLFKSDFDNNMGSFAFMPQSKMPYPTTKYFGLRHSQHPPNHTAQSKRTVTLKIVVEFFPGDNAHSAIDEAHATGLFA
ncbi:hypothetical protein V8E52_009386 [Russula decolorans]